MTENIYELLKDFIERNKNRSMGKSEWIYTNEFEVYVRLGSYMIERKLEKCFVIGTIQVVSEYEGKGYFRNLVKAMEELNPTEYLYVQSVMATNDRMTSILERNGFRYADNYDTAVVRNYYKRKITI